MAAVIENLLQLLVAHSRLLPPSGSGVVRTTGEPARWCIGEIPPSKPYPSPVAPPRTPEVPVAALRQGFEAVAHDPAFERELIARQGVPYSHIGTAQGQAIFRALAEASPDVIRTLHQSTKGPN